MIKYKNIPMKFHSALWSQKLREEVEALAFGYGLPDNAPMGEKCAVVAVVFLNNQVADSTLWNYITSEKYTSGTVYPNMTNFLYICNEFGFDPRDFFILER